MPPTSPAPAPSSAPEPWLSGSHTDVPAAARAVLHALELAQDDIRKWTAGLTDLEIHTLPHGLPPLAFHLRHIARSVDRILTYAEGNQLSDGQLALLKSEQVGPQHGERETLAALIAEIERSFANAAQRIRALGHADFDTPRTVGRKQLPTSLGGALIHVADHTQRHTGQVITTARVLKALRA